MYKLYSHDNENKKNNKKYLKLTTDKIKIIIINCRLAETLILSNYL